MPRGFLVILAGASVAAVSLVGCSSDKSTPTAGKTVTYDGGAMTENATATATIDGQPHKVEGPMACTAFDDDDFVISIGTGLQSVKATLSSGDEPTVSSVHLGDLAGYVLVVSGHSNGGEAKVVKDGKKYTITGTAFGMDTVNTPVTKPFEVELTCP